MTSTLLCAIATRACVALAFSAITAGAACAQSAPDDTLYRQLGGQPGLVALTDDFMHRLHEDLRMAPFFQDVDERDFKTKLAAQFCEVAGGPCRYKGKGMQTVHSEQNITRSNFNALVEVLQQSMDAQGIPFSVQNKLLAQLAPMHREIVNVP